MFKETPLFSITNQKFNVIILAAGLGTRLKPATDYVPKALIRIGKDRAIDYSVRKYQYIADRIIIATGYSADLLENYVKGKYSSLNPMFSREHISELRGPGRSLVYALDYASSKLPTLITFCDYIIEDYMSVDSDMLSLCKPSKEPSVLGTYDSIAVVEEETIMDLVKNKDIKNIKENGFTGIAVCQNTMLLKSITYSAALSKRPDENVDYTFDIIREYILKVKTIACPLSKIFEFGAGDTLEKTRKYINGSN